MISETTIHEVVQRLVNEFNPEQVILFGSYAWGTPSEEDSDLDLLVIVPQSDEEPTQVGPCVPIDACVACLHRWT